MDDLSELLDDADEPADEEQRLVTVETELRNTESVSALSFNEAGDGSSQNGLKSGSQETQSYSLATIVREAS